MSTKPLNPPPSSSNELKATASPPCFTAASEFSSVELSNATGLKVQLLPTGAVLALRHESTLLNQLLPGPAEDGLFRLLLRWRRLSDGPFKFASLVGTGLSFSKINSEVARWVSSPTPGLQVETYLRIHPRLTGWSWRVRVRNDSSETLMFDVLQAQDLGLADEGAVRNNEAYTSQYIDLLPINDPLLGWSILARQNQAMAKGKRPWLALACSTGAVAFCTDGRQFFGSDYRLTGEPVAAREAALPSQRLQQEFALGGLQSRTIQLEPGTVGEFRFVARFLADHPAASSIADLPELTELLEQKWDELPERAAERLATPAPVSLFCQTPCLHGNAPSDAQCAEWFPGTWRHEERAADGTLLSFFSNADTHVVTLAKEAMIARPHGHILRSGDGRWFDAGHFGITCYAAGIFSAQAYLGHPSFARLLSVVRNALNVVRGSGQRIFVDHAGSWRQLGVPSAFAMTPSDVRWIYHLGREVVEVRAWCTPHLPSAFIKVSILAGQPCRFLFSHEVVLGAVEYEYDGQFTMHLAEGWVCAKPSVKSMVGTREPAVSFAIAAADANQLACISDDRLLYPDGVPRGGPYVTLQTRPVSQFSVILLGTHEGVEALPRAVAAARATFIDQTQTAHPPRPAIRLSLSGASSVERVNEILPWYAHNASIHFSAPHGLEQYGGAAWGVRDVCQGSLEWLLSSGDFSAARRMLETVFAQQYVSDGSWPQWFMHPPYHAVQQAHSHGDVCFWPVKALCDYVEASNDLEFLNVRLPYTDPTTFEKIEPVENVLEHCDRVIALCESRFVTNTALVNYGDGDWDDTLQPADPAMRTRLISSWTVALSFHTFRQLGTVCRRAGHTARVAHLENLCVRIRADLPRLMPDGIVAGFGVTEAADKIRPLLHPTDTVTHIRYRLLPMTRSILAELFTLEEATRHLAIVEKELRYPDGVRLMSEPSTYQGGCERLFKRAETASNVGREIGLQYVHAHLRYAEALAKVGNAEGLWRALQVVNPVGLATIVPNAASRQSNTYFSSSDADFPNRYEAAARWTELRTGSVAVNGGWRLYSSGPGIFMRVVRACLLGIRESFDTVVFDPVLPLSLDGLVAETHVRGRRVELRYRVKSAAYSPRAVLINGAPCTPNRQEINPYRSGGFVIAQTVVESLLTDSLNVIEIEL